MPAVRGGNLLIKRGDGMSPETFTTVGALRNATVTINGNPIDVTTADDVDGNDEIWRAMITGVKDLQVAGDGVAKAIEPAQSVLEDFIGVNTVITNYQVVIPYIGTFELPMIVGNMEFNGNYDDAARFSLSLQSAGAPEFTAETV